MFLSIIVIVFFLVFKFTDYFSFSSRDDLFDQKFDI